PPPPSFLPTTAYAMPRSVWSSDGCPTEHNQRFDMRQHGGASGSSSGQADSRSEERRVGKEC
ncbi:hypothetical protein MMA97_26380, partial [Salmonella enterica]|nr:hypothetical protein [Salmonella enterica]